MTDESKTQDFHNHQIRIAEETLDLEKKKLEFEKVRAKIERRFFNRNLGIIITSIVTLTAIWVSWYQFKANQSRSDYQFKANQSRIEEQLELRAISIITDQISRNLDEQSFNKQLQSVRKVIKAALPEHVANNIVSRIDKSDLFLSQLEGWSADRQAFNEKPVVLLLDTNYSDNVYSETQKSLGGTNAEDIFEVLSDLEVQLIRDVITANWENEILIWRLKPKLIILHRSCFEYDSESGSKAEEELKKFIKKINDFLPETKLIIYSILDCDVFKEKITHLKNTFPKLLIEYYCVKDPYHFRALINADGLKQKVKETLNIKDSNEAKS